MYNDSNVVVQLDLIVALKRLVREAEQGKVSGLAVVVITPEGHETRLLGEASARPTYTLGAIVIAQQQLGDYARLGSREAVARTGSPQKS